MDVETISKAGTGYTSPEPVKVSVPSPERAQVVVETAAPAVAQSGMTGGKSEAEQNFDGGKRDRAPSEATVDDAVKSANRRMDHTRCEYSYHKELNRVSIKVINDDTGEVIREIPPEKSLDMLQKMWEMAGILVDEKR